MVNLVIKQAYRSKRKQLSPPNRNGINERSQDSGRHQKAVHFKILLQEDLLLKHHIQRKPYQIKGRVKLFLPSGQRRAKLPGNIINDTVIQDALKDLREAKKEQERKMAVDTASATSGAPSPGDMETKHKLPFT